MKKGGQRQKSGRHERRIGKLFDGEWYPDDDGEFRRTPSSGGWDKRIAPGDIQPFKFMSDKSEEMQLDNSFPFSVECKDWHDDNVKHIFAGLYGKPSQVYDWMEQAEGDAQASGKIPVVIFKLYRTEDLVMMLMRDRARLRELFGIFEHGVYQVIGGPEKIIFCRFKPWLEWIDWGFYKALHRRKGYVTSLVPKS